MSFPSMAEMQAFIESQDIGLELLLALALVAWRKQSASFDDFAKAASRGVTLTSMPRTLLKSYRCPKA